MIRLFLHELRTQQRIYWRNREAAFFTFLLPIIFLVLLGSVYGDNTIDGVKGSTFLLAGMLGYGIAAAAFAGLSISLIIRRESGVLKRVRGTPMSPGIYVAAIMASTLVVIGLEAVAQILIGHYAIDAAWPQAPGSFILAVAIGSLAFAALGLALTAAVRSAEGSSAVVNAVYLPMAFISGAFFSPKSLPEFLEAISNVLPLTYLLRLLRATFIDGESIGSQPEWLVAVLLWGLVGATIAVRTFRWEPRAV